jgi:hypothetical protein
MPCCFLPKLTIKLADGKEYICRQLPFNRQLSQMVENSRDENAQVIDRIEAMREIIRKSMSFDHDAETIEGLFDAGLIMISADPDVKSEMIQIFSFAVAGKRPAPESASTSDQDSFVAEAGG